MAQSKSDTVGESGAGEVTRAGDDKPYSKPPGELGGMLSPCACVTGEVSLATSGDDEGPATGEDRGAGALRTGRES